MKGDYKAQVCCVSTFGKGYILVSQKLVGMLQKASEGLKLQV